jgi:PAS domain S-box-containing protein
MLSRLFNAEKTGASGYSCIVRTLRFLLVLAIVGSSYPVAMEGKLSYQFWIAVGLLFLSNFAFHLCRDNLFTSVRLSTAIFLLDMGLLSYMLFELGEHSEFFILLAITILVTTVSRRLIGAVIATVLVGMLYILLALQGVHDKNVLSVDFMTRLAFFFVFSLFISHLASESSKARQAVQAGQVWLKEAEERYRALFERSLDCVYLHDFAGNFIDANAAALNLLGYRREEIPDLHFTRLIGPDQLPRAYQTIEELRTTGIQKATTEYRLRRKDGGFVEVETQASLIFRNEKPYAIQGIARDITERKRTEALLTRKVTELKSFINNIPDMAWLKDVNSNFIAANMAFGRAVGKDPDYLISHTCEICFGKEAAEKFKADDRRIMENRKQEIIEESIRDANGNLVCLETIKSPIVDDAGAVIGTVGVARDITKRKALEDKLLQMQKMEAIGTLAGGIAHDFNNILAGILGHANRLKLESPPGGSVHQSADVIERAADRGALLTRQLLGYARKGKNRNIPMDLHAMIRDVIDILNRTIDPRITLVQKLAARSATVLGDPAQLQQVVLNLAVNGRDAMPEGGSLSFETRLSELDESALKSSTNLPPGRILVLSVSDTGSGIPSHIRHRIFEPFFTTKEQGKGTGMGLAMTYGIVKNHGGEIDFISGPEGTTFTLRLPFHDAGIEIELPSPSAKAPIRGRGRILVADDDEIVRDMVRQMLVDLGYEVTAVADGRETVAYYADHAGEVDLVLLDLAMPRMNGHECFRELKRIRPNVRVILSSGHGSGDAGDPEADGFAAFLRKPYTFVQISEAVAQALA